MGEVVAVASVVYNLAGDITKRPSYLKSLVIHNVMSGTREGIPDTLRSGYLGGPAMKLRAFYRWARSTSNYGQVGMPSGQLEVQGDLDSSLVAPFIPHGEGETVAASAAYVKRADPLYWAEQWILANRVSDLDTTYTVDYIDTTNSILITFVDATTETIPAADFLYDSRYIFTYYQIDDGGTLLWIYRIGSGNTTLDAISETATTYGEFFPFLPVRLNNKFLSDSYLPNAFKQVKKAYRKAMDGRLDALVEALSDNPDLGDIDHAYVTFGVSLNTVEQTARKYIYRFFDILQSRQTGTLADYENWLGGENHRSGFGNTIRVKGSGEVNSFYDIRINWKHIAKGTGTGLAKAGAKTDEIWLEHTKTDNVYQWFGGGSDSDPYLRKVGEVHHMRITWQRTTTSYTYLDVIGAEHSNYIYKGHAVHINSKQALADGDESGFIIPLHLDIWKQLSLVDGTQMSTACCFLVLNCYEARKKKWYESGIFKIFLVIAIAIASAIFFPGGIGLLGAHLSVGVSLGFSGMMAVIVGSTVNALAALMLMTILEKTLGNLGVIGAVLSAVIMIVIGQVSAAFQSPGAMAFNWGDLLRVDNLLKLTDAVGRGVGDMFRQDTLALQQDWLDFAEKAKQEAKKIQQAYFEEFGYGAGVIDPFMFVDSTGGSIAESSQTFLTRTLMTGSEIAEMSRELLYGFPELSLKLPDAFT